MPTVPIIEQPQQQSRGFSSQGFSVRASPQAFGSGIAEGMGQFGQVANEIAERERDRQNSVQVTSAERQLMQWETERLYGDDGALNRKGRDAFGAPEEVLSEYQEKAEEIRQGLGNDEQRQAFNRVVASRLEDTRRTMLRHERQQFEEFAEAETQAFLETSTNAAAANYTDPERIQRELSRQEAAIRSQAQRNGLGDEVAEQRVSAARSNTHTAVLSRMLAQDQYRQAKSYLEENRDQLQGDQLAKMEKSVEAGTLRAESQDATDRILSETDDRETAIEQARRIQDPQLRDETTDRINKRFQEQDMIQEERQRERMERVRNTVEETGDTDQISADDWSELTLNQRNALERRARQVREGIEPVTDWQDYYELTRMASDPERQREFARMDLIEHRENLSNTEFKELVRLQESVQANVEESRNETTWLRNKNQMVDDAVREMGLSPTPDDEDDAATVRQFRGAVQDEISLFRQRNGREPGPQELEGMIDRLMLQGEVRGGGFRISMGGTEDNPLFSFGIGEPSKRFFELEEGERQNFYIDDVPDGERQKIIDALKARDMRVTDEAIVNLYTMKKLGRGSGGGRPSSSESRSGDSGRSGNSRDFGERPDGTEKGAGFFGVLERPDGQVSTEISIGVKMGGEEVQIPALVPTLTRKQIDHLLEGGEVTDDIARKAAKHARQRINEGKSPFAQKGEQRSLPGGS